MLSKQKVRSIHCRLLKLDYLPDINILLIHFYVKPECQSDCIATTDFAGQQIPVAVKRENIFGFQFHPEKSAEKGLMLLNACTANSCLD